MFIPNMVSIQTTHNCNLRCTVCPVFGKNPTFPDLKGKIMSIGNFEKIIKELVLYSFRGVITIGNFGEPLTDPLFNKRIEIINKYNLGNSVLTNGTLLTNYIKQNEYNKNYIPGNVCISILGDLEGKYSYKNITGCDIDKTIDNIIFAHNAGIYVVISSTPTFSNTDVTKYIISKLIEYPDIGINMGFLMTPDTPVMDIDIYNEINDLLIKYRGESFISTSLAAFLPSDHTYYQNIETDYICPNVTEILSIYVNGDMELCCKSSYPVGNVFEKPAIELFNSRLCNKYREELNSKTGNIVSCQECSVIYDDRRTNGTFYKL